MTEQVFVPGTERLERYAALLLDTGVGLQPGQRLAINAEIEHAPLVRTIADQAYQRGAAYVDVWYWEPYAKRARVLHAPEDTLSWTPPWLDRRYEDLSDGGDALINIRGDSVPDLLSGLDGRRVGLDRMPDLASRFHAQSRGLVAWTIACYPTAGWAESVFGTPDVERLWTHLEQFLHLDRPDPSVVWTERLNLLRDRARVLTGLRLDAVRFVGPGTDLRIGLIPEAGWRISELTGPRGIHNALCLPTEEVYTTPDHRRVDGHVRSTKPLALAGTLVRDLELTFTAGRVSRVTASTGADVVRNNQSIDDGAAMLGEVALVDETSPIGRSGVTFQNTLLDENATCHIAWGGGIPSVLDGWRDLTSEQLLELGVNQSTTHIDFMVGGPEVSVIGVRHDGGTVEILRNGHWRLPA
jgi:aminopeptidase